MGQGQANQVEQDAAGSEGGTAKGRPICCCRGDDSTELTLPSSASPPLGDVQPANCELAGTRLELSQARRSGLAARQSPKRIDSNSPPVRCRESPDTDAALGLPRTLEEKSKHFQIGRHTCGAEINGEHSAQLRSHILWDEDHVEPQFPNKLVKWLWPYVSGMVTDKLKVAVEPALRKAFGKFGKNVSFDRSRCHLGDIPITFDEIAMSRTAQNTLHGTLENLLFRSDIKWQGHPEIYLNFPVPKTQSIVKIGVTKVTICGVLLMECVGLVPEAPLFHGVRAYFINPPKIELEFDGFMGSALNFQGIKRAIQEIVADQIAMALVLPHTIGMRLMRDVDFFHVMRPRTTGILELVVQGAEGVRAADVTWFGLGKATSDPYVVVQCGATRLKSKPIMRTTTPHFEYKVRLFIVSTIHQHLHLEIWDMDKLSEDDFLGKLEIPVSRCISWGDKVVSFDLADENGQVGSSGKVWLRATWRPVLNNIANITGGKKDHDAAYVFVGVHNASHVPRAADDTNFWVDVHCSGLVPGPESERAFQTKRVQQPIGDMTASEMKEREALLGRKVSLLQKHKVPPAEMAEILEVESWQMELLKKAAAVDLNLSTMNWNQGFEFLVASHATSTITVELRSQRPDAKEVYIGAGVLPISKFLHSGPETITLAGTNIKLKVSLELCHLGLVSS